MPAPAYQTLNYERNDRTKQTSRSDDSQKIDIAPVFARFDALFRAREEVAIHHRSRALRGDRRDLGLADLRGSGRAGEVYPGQPKLTKQLIAASEPFPFSSAASRRRCTSSILGRCPCF